MNTEAQTKSEVALREEAIQVFWEEHNIFKKSLETPAGSKPKGDFVFYDGPPFATGLPHYGHILAGTIKDAVPRFWTMNGYRVRRKWGWDCHGLPLENLIEKKLGLATKRDIEAYGVKNFNEAARGAVLEYADDWKRIIPRMGRFVDMDDDYKTMDASYTESVWWVFSELNRKGLVFEGFKSMHLCPRCGTTLSNFEVNLGYKDIKDIAVTVKLPLLDEADAVTDTSLLVWTTTPWTLPGNMAAAVHKEYDYVKTLVTKEDGENLGTEYVILAKAMLQKIGVATELKSGNTLYKFGDEFLQIVEELKGADLVGKRYQPPFPYLQNSHSTWGLNPQVEEQVANAWTIYHADYVELGEEGTGAVHLAPAYGEEDMVLAKEQGVPIVHHVDSDGHFKDFVTDFAGQLVKPKDDDDAGVTHLNADIEIVKALKENGKLFKKENITHSYPHCWRCDTPLLNYATTSWFVNVPKIKDELVAENQTVHWVPEHVGSARFGKWLEGARDWAVSRQRYWGAPLPIWRHPETKEYKIFGSLAELQEHTPKSGNSYFTMRHGESTKNTTRVITDDPNAPYPLTEKGKADVKAAVAALKGQIDLVITSPVLRAKETADLVVSELGLSAKQLVVDERIRESGHGVYEGKSVDEFYEAFPNGLSKFEDKPEGGENWTEIKQRMGAFLYDTEATYKDKQILIVSHGDPLAQLHGAAKGLDRAGAVATWDNHYPEKGVIDALPFVPLPHNDDYELDFHRPYIDEFVVCDTDGTRLERIPDVFDCWFESGSMPYAETHYPFANLDVANPEKGIRFPADFISEAVDQTRGWFYSLMVLGVALFGKAPYKNVITNGLVLAEDGKKMSKSLQNYPDPMYLADTVGVDSMRYYLLSSPIIKGEDLNFSEKGVLELQRKNIGRLHNVLAMYLEYEDERQKSKVQSPKSNHVLDRWIIARLNQLIEESTDGYKSYELDKATRPITDFIDDLSVWYLRRSRDRLKSDDMADKAAALATLKYVLQHLALVMAPPMPFYAEYLWQAVRTDTDAQSVHLAAWPKADTPDPIVLGEMNIVREFVNLAHEARAQAGIKVRQPLPALRTQIELAAEYADIVTDEINVKDLVFVASMENRIELDTTITPELQVEGDAREFIRQVQALRKDMGLSPKDRIGLTVQTSDSGEAVVKTHQDEIMRVTGAEQLTFGNAAGTEVKAGVHEFTVEITKV